MVRRIVAFALLAALVAAPALAAVVTESVTARAAVGENHDKININTASAKELQKLEGVGHTVAERIVHYREEHGPFKRGEDLRKVEGIGSLCKKRLMLLRLALFVWREKKPEVGWRQIGRSDNSAPEASPPTIPPAADVAGPGAGSRHLVLGRWGLGLRGGLAENRR